MSNIFPILKKGNSDQYREISTDEVLGSVARQLGDYMGPTKRFGIHGRGTTELIRVALNMDPITVHGEEKGIAPQLYLWNSFKGEAAFVIMLGYLRAACQNFCHVGEAFFKERIVHRTGETCERKLLRVKTGVAEAVDYMANGFKEDLEEMTTLDMTEEQMIQVAYNLNISNRDKDNLLARIVKPGLRIQADQANNVWTLYQLANRTVRDSSQSTLRFANKDRQLLDDVVNLSLDVTGREAA